jgi:hypothetical protein
MSPHLGEGQVMGELCSNLPGKDRHRVLGDTLDEADRPLRRGGGRYASAGQQVLLADSVEKLLWRPFEKHIRRSLMVTRVGSVE